MSEALTRFQDLLRELFLFDCADLDFGIYRIINHKRAVIEKFISEDLPSAVAEELKRDALGAQAQAAQALEDARKKVVETLGRDALDAEGNLVKYHETQVGKAYLEAQQRARGSRAGEALEADIYNHLYTFFSRYWQDGDFISKRRYSRKERYAIPYNGEEVYLYWANHDQYYIKTGEHFTDYTYRHPNGVTVYFKLCQADVEQNNVKGEKRFFLPRLDAITWDAQGRTLTIPFEYRPLTAQESSAYGQAAPNGNGNGQKNVQDAIIAGAVDEIPKRIKDPAAWAALTTERRKDASGNAVSWLAHHLRQYTRRNTSDFFIHKDLKGFLSRELDFYLKNEVLNLDAMEAAGEGLSAGWFQLMRLIKRIGLRIIEFLAQIEDFQKMLWEKRKFVTETFYCITVGNIPEAFYPEIAACKAQWDEWKVLFAIDEEGADLFTNGQTQEARRIAFLKAHPTLVLDTRHFSQDFTDRLLASFENLDEMTDGLLVHSENWQALNLLRDKYMDRIECIYIDPPYNTSASEILYKNNYKHSSWLCLITERISKSFLLMNQYGKLCIAIDDVEFSRLHLAIQSLFGADLILGVVVVRSNPAGRSALTGFSVSHDYTLFVGASENARISEMLRNSHQIKRYSEEDENGKFEWVNFRKHGGLNANKFARPKLFYPIYVAKDGKVRIPRMEWDAINRNWKVLERPSLEETAVWPIDDRGEEKTWKWGHETVLRKSNELRARQDRSGKVGIYMKSRMRVGTLPSTLWSDSKYSATDYGTNLLGHIMGRGGATLFSFPKSVYTVGDCLRISTPEADECVLDFFAGSGTTGHAVINLNREDGGRRRFILVEMAHYFDTVLLPRIKKVTFTPEWKDGKPRRMAKPEEAERSPRIVKVIRLESYEDALNNLSFDDESGAKALTLFKDDYLLSYMLKWETRGSETLLNVEKLQSPFAYKLRLHRDGETRERQVDLPETFAYLLGLDVQTRRVYDDRGRRYLVYRGAQRDGRVAVVIWRDTAGWELQDYERDAAFVAEHKLAEGAHEVFVNSDSRIPNAQSLDGLFKARMFAPAGT